MTSYKNTVIHGSGFKNFQRNSSFFHIMKQIPSLHGPGPAHQFFHDAYVEACNDLISPVSWCCVDMF